MNSRKDFMRRVAEFRWWGCVLLAMFVVVQTARGSDLSGMAPLTAPVATLDVARIAPAAPNNALAGDPQIQTP